MNWLHMTLLVNVLSLLQSRVVLLFSQIVALISRSTIASLLISVAQ